jgi:putative mRNA 3-end processing factor
MPSYAWLQQTPSGLYCEPGGFFIDPLRPVNKALVTHGHADHARPGHEQVLATPETLAIMKARYGKAGSQEQAAGYGDKLHINNVVVTFVPAGHILGSAQISLEYGGHRIVVSGDYKRRRDPTCASFLLQTCDLFITEATFGLPVFHHPADTTQIGKILNSSGKNPSRALLIGAYALGKCQRIIRLLREEGYDGVIYLHGAMISLCELYEAFGVKLGPCAPVADMPKEALEGKIVIAPPSALHDRWSRRLPDPIAALASGWMTIKQRAKQKLVELPLVISDHADWDELTHTLAEVQAADVWVTHGREDALVHYATSTLGLRARPLDLHGYEDEED